MKKLNFAKFIFVLIVLIFISIHLSAAANFTYKYKNVSFSPINKVSLMIYKCIDTCTSLYLVIDTFSGDSGNISFSIPEGDLFRVYHATENCYTPQVEERGAYQADDEKTIPFLKLDHCGATISNLSVTQPVTVNQETEIKAKISSPLAKVDEYQQFGGKDMFVPEKLKRFFETDVTVQLLISNNIANSTEIAVPLSGKEVKFVYKFPQEGSYDITIKTIPTDCKCKSADETEVTLSVNVQPAPEIKNMF